MHNEQQQHAADRSKATGMLIASYILGIAGGLFLYTYLFAPALIGFVLLSIGLSVLIFFATRSPRAS
jgi:hypothetical protein